MAGLTMMTDRREASRPAAQPSPVVWTDAPVDLSWCLDLGYQPGLAFAHGWAASTTQHPGESPRCCAGTQQIYLRDSTPRAATAPTEWIGGADLGPLEKTRVGTRPS
jgi:hypothetical protein